MIDKLTPEQEALILVHDEKWRQIMYSTEPINREKAAEAVKEAYLAIDKKEPKIIFCGSPYEGANLVMEWEESTNQLYGEFVGVNIFDEFAEQLHSQTWDNLNEQISPRLSERLFGEFYIDIAYFFIEQLNKILGQTQGFLGVEDRGYIDPILWGAEFCAIFDFCFSVLKCNPNRINWQKLLFFTTQCGWIFP